MSERPPPGALIRAAAVADFPAILALNAESVHFLSPMDRARLEHLHAQAAYHRVVDFEGQVGAFLLAFREGADYDSPNYVWFAQRYDRFLYIDRVVVAAAQQGKRFGALLYQDLFKFALGSGVPHITCEFDVEPPNEVSRRFHAAFGFHEVGSQWVGGGKKRVSLQQADPGALQLRPPAPQYVSDATAGVDANQDRTRGRAGEGGCLMTGRTLFDLTGRTAIVTGGSRGLGLQIAEALGDYGAKLVLVARKQGELDEAIAHLGSRNVESTAIAADLSKPESVQQVAEEALGRLGKIDILVNNAGATWGAPAEDYPLDGWDKVMNLNVRSVFLLSQAVAKRSMIPRKYGRIVNVASIAGLKGNPPGGMQTVAYNTSKGAVINFTRVLGSEWGKYNITVNAIAPGMFPSKMSRGTLEAVGADNIARRAPLQRIGDDEDLKGVALLFASDAGKHITGQVIAVDGGYSIC